MSVKVYTILYFDGEENNCQSYISNNTTGAVFKFRRDFPTRLYDYEVIEIMPVDLELHGYKLVKA